MGDEVCNDGENSEACPDCTAIVSGWYCDTYPCTTTCGDEIVAGSEVCDTGNDVGCDDC